MHSILSRQIKKFLGNDARKLEELKDFLNAVNESYGHFDEDRKLAERSLELSSKELGEQNRILTERGEQHNELSERIKLILDSTDEGIYGTDLIANCIIFNKSAARMTGYSQEELL